MKYLIKLFLVAGMCLSFNANAWFFFFIPLPTGIPPSFHTQIKTLEDSNQTKAYAYVGEDKTFGSKYYVSGWYLGDLSQKEAIKIALEKCNANLEKAKQQTLDGSPRWNFGDKKCELYGFPKMPETAVMPSSEEMVLAPQTIIELKQVDSFTTPLMPAVKQDTPVIKKNSETKLQVDVPVDKPLTTSDGTKRLVELKGLLDQGLITQKDYDQKKIDILKQM
jgi:hypothetical protein